METSGVVEGHGVEAGKVECEPSLIEADLGLKGDSTGLSGDGSGKQEEDNDGGDNLVGGEECKSELSDFPSDHVSDTRLDALESQGFVNADNGHDDSESLLCENKGSETEFLGSGETEAEVRVPVDTNCNLELQDLENDEHELELQSLVNGGNEPETGLEKYGDREIETTCLQNGESGIETTCVETETLLANGDNELQIECSVHGNCQGELPCVVIEQPGTETHLSVEGNGELETRVLVNGNRENESQCIVSEDNQLELQCGVNGDGELEPQHTIHAEPESDLNEVKKLESQCSVNGDDGIARVARGEEVGDVPLGNDEISDLESGSCNGSNIDAVSDLPDEKSEGCNETQQSDAKDANWVSVVDPEPSHELPSSAGDWVSTVNGEPSNKQLCPAADWVSTVDGEPSNEQFCPAADWVPVVDPEPSNGMLSPPALANEQKSEADAPKKTVYCLVKIPRHVDNKIKAQIRLAQLQLNEKTERRDFIRAALQMKRASREEMLDRLRTARYEERVTRDAIRCKRQEMEPVQLTLNKMKNATSVEEFEEKIYHMEYRIEHETMPLREEKQLVREINQLKLTRDQLCASAGPHLELQEAFDQIDKIQEHSKMLGQEMDSLRKQAFEAEKNTQSIEKDFVALNDALKQLQGQWNAADIVRQEAYEVLRALKKQEYEKNNEFYKNKGDIQAAKHHALARNMEALDELCSNQVERIMEMWNKNVEFRKEYMKDNERSTLKRLETLDGRLLGPDEEPPLPTSYSDDLDPSSVPQAKPSSSNAKPEREDRLTTAVQQSNEEESKTNGQLVPPKEAEAPKKSSAAKSRKPQPQIVEAIPKIEAFEMSPVSVEKEEEDLAKKEEEAAKLKERRRLEEMTKAKEAEERKRRLAEKAKAKANARAQKESERKEKERQKRANKRAAAAAAANRTGDDTTSSSDRVQVDSSQNSKSPVVEMKETKAVSQKPATLQHKKLVSQKSKPRSVFLPAKKSRKGPQIWMWILLAVVLCLSFLIFQQLYL